MYHIIDSTNNRPDIAFVTESGEITGDSTNTLCFESEEKAFDYIKQMNWTNWAGIVKL